MTLVAEIQFLAGYEYLRNVPKEAWVWEYLRRNKAYIRAYRKHCRVLKTVNTSSKSYSQKETEAAAQFGLLFFRRSKT